MPTLDELAAKPELARELSRDAAFRLHLQAQAVVMACALALVGELDRQDEALLDVREAARVIGVSPITLAHRARKEPYCRFLVPTGSRTLRFSARAIREWQDRARPKSNEGGPV